MLINPLDYTIKELNKLPPTKGRILIAEPFMDDPHFKRSVILLTEYNENEVFGFMLNKLLNISVRDVLPNFTALNAPVFMGGPVQTDSLFYIHTRGESIEGSQHIIGNLYWAGNFNQLQELINNQQISSSEIIFFLGYSGWDYRQLENEIKEDSWIISDINDNKLIENINENDLWQKSLQKMGPKYAILSNFPEDPALN